MPKLVDALELVVGCQVDLQGGDGDESCFALSKVGAFLLVGNVADRPYPVNRFSARIVHGDDTLLVVSSAQSRNFNALYVFRHDCGDIDIPQDRLFRRIF